MARQKKSKCSCGMGALSRPSTGQRVVFDPGAGAEDRYRHEFVFPGMQGTVGEGSATGWTPAPYCNQERTLVEVHWDAGRTTCVPPRFLSLAKGGRKGWKGLGDKERPAGQHHSLMQGALEDAPGYRKRGDWWWYSKLLQSAAEQAAHLDWHARQGEKIPYRGLGRKSGYTAEREHLPQIYLETYSEWDEIYRQAMGANAVSRHEDADRLGRVADRLKMELEVIAERMTPEQFSSTWAWLARVSITKHFPGLGAPVRRPCSCPRKR